MKTLPAHEAIPELADEAAPAADVPVMADDAGDGLPAAAELQDDGSVVLPLARPVALRFRRAGSGEVVEEVHERLHLHRLTGADINAISTAAADKRAAVAIARAARMQTARMLMLYERMDGADVMAASAVLGHFLGTGAATGR